MFNIVKTNTAPHPKGPYAQAIDTGRIIFISGQIGMYPDMNEMSKDINIQTHIALKNIKNILENINLRVSNIVKITIFLINIHHLLEVNIIYKTFFNKNQSPFPARTCVEVTNLPNNAQIEIEAIAIYN